MEYCSDTVYRVRPLALRDMPLSLCIYMSLGLPCRNEVMKHYTKMKQPLN